MIFIQSGGSGLWSPSYYFQFCKILNSGAYTRTNEYWSYPITADKERFTTFKLEIVF